MTEKVIHQLTVTETDDGFRIEIKGDKERLRAMGFGEGMAPFGRGFMGRGPFGHHGPFGGHRGHFGPGHFGWHDDQRPWPEEKSKTEA